MDPHNGTEQVSGFIGLPNTVMGKHTCNYNAKNAGSAKPVKLLSSHSMEAAKSKILEKNTKNNSKNVTPQN